MALRRQPYFLPTQITGCSLWLDGADPAGNSIIPSTGTLETWVDKSGNGNNATQSSSGNRPTYSNNGLVFTGSHWFQTPITSFPTAESIFIVFKSNSGIADIFSGTTLNSREVLLYSGNKLFLGRFGTDPSSTTPNAGAIPLNTTILYSIQYTSSAVTFNVNGTTTGSGTPFFTFSGTGTSWIGANTYNPNNMYGTIYEFIYYNNSLSSNQRLQVEAYLAQKWGLTASLPADHPGLTSILYRVQRPFFTKTPYFAVFSPRQISGCILWLDGADPSANGIIPADGATVSTWVDKSGLVNNATTHSGITTYSTSLKALFFSNSGFQTSIVTPTNRVGSGFFVVRVTVNAANVIFQGSGLSHGGRQFRNDGGTTLKTVKENIVEMFNAGPTLLNTLMLVGYIDDGNNLTHCVNGTLFTTTTATTFTAGTTILLGKSFNGEYLIGFIHEVILFNTNLNTTERQQVESYLAQKWGLTSSLPAGHLNTTFPVGSPAVIQPFISRIRPALTSIPFVGGGGTSSSSGNFSIRTFTTTSQLILSKSISATILVVGGGGGGGSAGVQTGGGGAGGAVFVSSPVTINAGTYAVTVGTGGGINTNGTNSTFLSYTGTGGGGGGNWINGAGKTGGCGGGGSGEGGSGAAGSQGFGGANGRGQFTCGGGGGGMGQAGKQPADGSPSSGGNGLQYSITGSAVYYAGGGAGGFNSPSTGGLGGGGDKTVQGTDGLGGGGGSGARGGNGVVIISFVFI
jgi:hypothetical protein